MFIYRLTRLRSKLSIYDTVNQSHKSWYIDTAEVCRGRDNSLMVAVVIIFNIQSSYFLLAVFKRLFHFLALVK